MAKIHVVLLLGLAPLARGQEVRFVVGDPATLSCKVLKDVSERSGRRRLWVEVANGGEHTAEPLEFRIEHRSKKLTVKEGASANRTEVAARCAFPFAERRGRGVPSRGKQRYWLAATTGPDEDSLAITVSRACFLDPAAAAEIPAPRLGLGKPEQIPAKGMNGEDLRTSRVQVVNPLASTVDVVFLATLTEPRNEPLLLGARLAPGANDWVISEVPPDVRFEYSTPTHSVKVERLELVDWCLVAAHDSAAAAARFEPAYRGWLRWSEPFPGVAGTVRCSVRFSNGPGSPLVEHRIEGEFTLDSEGGVSLELDPARHPKIPAETLRGLQKTSARNLRSAFADLRRASFEELKTKNVLRFASADAVEVAGPGFVPTDTPLSAEGQARDPEQTPNYTLRGERIAKDGSRSSFEGRLWTTRDLAGGYVVTERRTPAGDWCYQYAYELLNGLPVPSAYRECWGTVKGDLLKEFQAQFSGLRFLGANVAVEPRPPTGPGVDALRAVWEQGYRYADTPRNLRFAFEVRTPGTDLTWQGFREVDGRASLATFRGFRMGTSNFGAFEAEFKTPMSEGQRSSLGFAFFDRLVLWAGRDFNGRDSFEAQFSGCEISEPAADGSFTIAAGIYDRVQAKDGVVVALRSRNRTGGERRFVWSKVGERRVVTKVVTGEEELNVKFASVDGVLLPTEFEFLRVFGRGWGPERIKLREVSLR